MTLQIKKYVLGLAFWRDQVALIYKTKGPEYVIGTWNGIGGKIEDGETVEEAMEREFLEETGIDIPHMYWNWFATQTGNAQAGNSYELNCLMVKLSDAQEFDYIINKEGDGEIVKWIPYNDYEPRGLVEEMMTPNLKWLIPLALDHTTGFLNIQEQ